MTHPTSQPATRIPAAWLISGGETLARERDLSTGWIAARDSWAIEFAKSQNTPFMEGFNAFYRKQAELARRGEQ